MIDLKALKHVHLIGIGGINMSAVAKLLLASGISVSGSDLIENDQTRILTQRGATIAISESADNIPADCQLVIFTSAAPTTNKERLAAAKRKIPEITNFAFLGQWFADSKTIVIAGTHGKSTTTAMLGLILEKAGLDPTVVVGSNVSGFPDGNLRLGQTDLFVVEGDEYARHFLEFHPYGLILNNLELDHTDVFRSIDNLLTAFHELVGQVHEGGIIVTNETDQRLSRLIETEKETLAKKNIQVVMFGEGPSVWRVDSSQNETHRTMALSQGDTTLKARLLLPGHFNSMNAAAAWLMARRLGTKDEDAIAALEVFRGIWRRFEFLKELDGARLYSDYGHHPTAVAETLIATRESFPKSRVVLCFQPHHRNRTKNLFFDFVTSFDEADIVVLSEIYEVAGRDAKDDEKISSTDLIDALIRHDADRGVTRSLEFAATPDEAVKKTLSLIQPNDIVMFMGAGDIDQAARTVLSL